MNTYIIDNSLQRKADFLEVTPTGALMGMIDITTNTRVENAPTSISIHSYTELLWALAPGYWTTVERVE